MTTLNGAADQAAQKTYDRAAEDRRVLGGLPPVPTVEEIVTPLLSGLDKLARLSERAECYEFILSFKTGGATDEERADAQHAIDVARDAIEMIAMWMSSHFTGESEVTDAYATARSLLEGFADMSPISRQLASERCWELLLAD